MLAAGLYGTVAGAQTPVDALLSRIEFLEDHLLDMGDDARDAERECWLRPTDPAARARLEVIYLLARDVRAGIEQLTRNLPKGVQPRRRERDQARR